MTESLVSIIIPVYNVDAYIGKCIESCLRQNYRNIEVIAVNDGSTDSSGVVLENYGKRDHRLTVIHQVNRGVVAARNAGIAAAHGEWLIFVDGDDYVTDNMVETLLFEVKASDADIVFGDFYLEKAKKCSVMSNSLPFGSQRSAIASALLTNKLQFSLCAKIIRSSLFMGISTPEDLKLGEDAYITVQLCDKAHKIALTGIPVYYYVMRKSSVTHAPSMAAVASKLSFIAYIREFYGDKPYVSEDLFMHSFATFVMNEYFAYLRMGGERKIAPQWLRDYVDNTCLNDKDALKNLPVWRIWLLRAYRKSDLWGKIIRWSILKLRIALSLSYDR